LVKKEHRRGDRHIVGFRKRPGFVRHSTSDVAAYGRVVGAKDVRAFRSVEGFSAKLEPSVLARLVSDSMVWVEEEGEVKASAVPWAGDRLNQRSLPLDGSADHTENGAGIHVAIVDTGINLLHSEFVGRIEESYVSLEIGNSVNDGLGHGTHVSASIAGKTYGVANGATIHAVRVLDSSGSGSDSSVIEGLDWVLAQKVEHPEWPIVVNMSLGGDPSPAFDSATCRLIAAGIVVVAAAGNDSRNACLDSPGHVWQALTVGASSILDSAAGFSNNGPCLDLHAPGVDVKSAWIGSATATNTISGTSMAAPHVAGIAVLTFQRNPLFGQVEVSQRIIELSTKDKLDQIHSGSPNLLGYAKEQ